MGSPSTLEANANWRLWLQWLEKYGGRLRAVDVPLAPWDTSGVQAALDLSDDYAEKQGDTINMQ